MYNGCHNDIRLFIDYTNIQILHVVKRFDIFSPITGGCSDGLGVL